MATLRWLCLRCCVLLIATHATAATYYVDDDAPNDPGPNNPNVSDPQESGSVLHPFDEVDDDHK